MTVAVTGATGFIGRHVVRRLLATGIDPTLVVRPGSAVSHELRGLRVERLDIADPPADTFVRLGRPDVVIHLAWDGLPEYAARRHLDLELPAQREFLFGLLDGGLRALTVTGTCLEYGLQSGALREDDPTAPVTAYGAAKDRLRRELQARSETFMFTWARLFYLYGEGQAPGSLVPQLEAAIRRGDETFPMSGGEQLRDYLPVEEVARDLVALALSGRDNGVVNVCSGDPIRVLDLVADVVAGHGSTISLDLGRYTYPAYEPMAFWGDPSKLHACLEAASGPVR